MIAALALLLIGQESSCEGAGDTTTTKDDQEIEREIADKINRRASELIVGEVMINCPGFISENLDKGKPTECVAEDAAGNVTEFVVRAKGEHYSYSMVDIALGLAGA